MANEVDPNGADLQATSVLEEETSKLNTTEANKGVEVEVCESEYPELAGQDTAECDFGEVQETEIRGDDKSKLNTSEAGKHLEVEVCESEYPELAGKEVRNVVILSVSYFCVASAYLALRNLQGSLNDENGLGVASLSCLYGISIISALLAPVCISFLGLKKTIIGSFATVLVYVLSNFYPSFATFIPASVICGGASGFLWTVQAIYLSACAFAFAEGRVRTLHSVLSKFNGIFWSILDSGIVVCNLVSSLILYQSNYETVSINASIYCGANDCPRNGTKDIIADPESTIVYILLGVLLALVATGIILVAVFLTPVNECKTSFIESLKDSLLANFEVIRTTDMKFLLPLSGYRSIVEQFVTTEITKSYVSCPFGIRNVGYTMMAYGGCSALGAFVFSKLARYIKRPYMLMTAFVCHFALQLWIINWIPQKHEIILVYILVAVWGLSDGVIRIQQYAMLAELFPRDLTAVFSVSEVSKGVCFTLVFMYSNVLCMKVKIGIVIVVLLISASLYLFVELRFIGKRKCIQMQETL